MAIEGPAKLLEFPWHFDWHSYSQSALSGPGRNIVTKVTWSHSWVTSAMQLQSSAKANHSSGFASSLSSGLHSWKGCLQRAWLFLELNVFMWFTKSRQSTLRRQWGVTLTFIICLGTNKKGWLINQILWTLPSSWRSCWNLADFKTNHYKYIQYHRWWLHPGRRAGCIWQTWWGRIFTQCLY